MIRNIASRVTGTAIATGRFAVGLPLGVARNVISHLPFVGGKDEHSEGPGATRPTPADAVSERAPQRSAEDLATAESKPSDAPPKGKPRSARTSGTPQAGPSQADDDKPEVVLAVDAPPEEIEPPVDVVGEALAAEKAEEAQQPPQPQPVHVNEQTEVVYSTTSDDD